jgi:hypothetical protein
MKMTKKLVLVALLALLVVPAAMFGQEQRPGRGMIEFGFRGVTGEVYGRTGASDIPFSNGFRPDVLNSTLNTYTDYRSGFYVPRFKSQLDGFLGENSYFNMDGSNSGLTFDGPSTLYRDTSFLATTGQYGLYKFQFRFDETPHIFSGTTRTLFAPGGSGVWTVNPSLQSAIYAVTCQGAGPACTAPTNQQLYDTISKALNGTLVAGVAGAQTFTQQEIRRMGTGSGFYNITPNVNVNFLFSREHQVGNRPLGMVMGTGAGSYQVEVPETIDYFTNNIRVGTDFGQKRWDGMLAYQGSFFENNVASMLVTNPFSSPSVTLTKMSTVGPATSWMNLYPSNHYQQFVSGGAVDIGKYVRLMANITPGLLTQTETFQPITTNTFLDLSEAAGHPNINNNGVAVNNLGGRVHTLAMNYTAVTKPIKNFQLVTKYQHYVYDNLTPDLEVRSVRGDVQLETTGCTTTSTPGYLKAGYCPTEQSSFTRKTFDVGGTYFITKKNSAKFGYQREWMDRTNRHVNESIENSVYGAVDLNLRKNVLLRVSGRHQNRMPQDYDTALGYTTTVATDYFFLRMPDQATRKRNRGDVSLNWDVTQRLSVSAFWGTLQDNFNVRDKINSLTPIGDATKSQAIIAGTVPTPIYGPYYAYGLLNNIGRSYGVDVNYVLTKNVVLFAEYVREKNTGVIVGGNQKATAACALNGSGFWPNSGCDPINDVVTFNKDIVNTYFAGADLRVSKRANVSVYYSLSAAQSYINSEGVNCQIGAGLNNFCDTHWTNWTLDTAPSGLALSFGFPESTSRTHEVGAVAKFKLTNALTPKFQYMFRQFQNNDFQTGVVNPLTYNPNAPYSTTVGNTTLAKMLFLGADTPSNRAHVFSGTLEYRF